ncbi:MAG: hypothetical protein DWQ47_14335 [Acidobacteria bacterium]|nr:MAG: hypothetical protein DWQ32_01735 [Acidobacteriota bacterium]REK02753.1 MAG: hypothetical protein DWQ38_10400 [Acidobacteriota bacterium]REK13442.1 MAG: hypothetical protein DWQ43_07425 [Acidobacteriota bacterium]REK41436.1 MAG: hypothetical protein DWQ47_14335 [Acidobacteriota bacterium]
MSLERKGFKFGDCFLDTVRGQLFRENTPLRLTPKLYETLCVFLESGGRLIEKDELLEHVWPETHVEESSLTFTISKLRKILGDDPKEPRFIETVPGIGYRFVARIELVSGSKDAEAPPGDPTAESPSKNSLRRRSAKTATIALSSMLLVVSVIAIGMYAMADPTDTDSLAATEPISTALVKVKGRSLTATLSPDGRQLAYTEENAGKVGIWLQDIDTTERRELLSPGDYLYFRLRFSPDSRRLYFVRRPRAGTLKADIYFIPTTGGVPTRVAENTEGAIDASPDGRLVAYSRYEDGVGSTLYVANSDGTNERPLTFKELRSDIRGISFSPDSQKLAFAVGQADDGTSNFSIRAIDLSTGKESELSSSRFYAVQSVVWGSEERGLLFTASSAYGKPRRIWQLDTGSGTVRPVSDRYTKFTQLSSDLSGHKLIATRQYNDFKLVTSSFASSNHTKVLTMAATADYSIENEIVYSTDEGEIWRIAPDSAAKEPITSSDSVDFAPLVSPDRRRIFYMSNNSGASRVWRMNADGSDKKQISRLHGGIPKYVSKDGRFLYFEANSTDTIWKVPTDGSYQEEEVWNEKVSNSRFSSDESKVAYLKYDKAGERRVRVLVADFSKKRVLREIGLPADAGQPIMLEWRKDARNISLLARNHQGLGLWEHDLETNETKFVRKVGFEVIRDFSISPDGNNYVMILGEWIRETVLMDYPRLSN